MNVIFLSSQSILAQTEAKRDSNRLKF